MTGTLRRLLGLLSPFAGRMLASVALGFLTVASGVGLMSTSAYIIARAALQPPLAELQVAIAGVRAFGIARGLLRYAERLLSHESALRILSQLRVWTYKRLEALPISKIETFRSGDLLARLTSDVSTLENFFVRALAPAGVAILTGLAMSIFLASFRPVLTLIYLPIFTLAAIAVPWLSFRWTKRSGDHLVSLRSEMFSEILDGLQGSAELLVFNQVDRHRSGLNDLTASYHRAQHQSAWYSGFTGALITFIANLSVIALFIVVIPLVQTGELTGIDLAVILLADLASFESVAVLPAAFQELNRDLSAGRRIFDLTYAGSQRHDPRIIHPAASPPVIEIRDLSYRYPGRSEPALDDVSLMLQPGQTLGLAGPSGSGKTTLIEILLGLRQAQTGQILINGQDTSDGSLLEAPRLFSLIPQSTFLFHSTLRENLLIADPAATEAQLIGALKQAGLWEFVAQLPDGLDTIVGEYGQHLSAGERQRVSIARAFLRDAPVLIMDEATTNLDPETEKQLWDSLSGMIATRSTLMVSHRLSDLQRCAEVIVLERGRVLERGAYSQLIHADGWFARAVRSERFDRMMHELLPAD